MYAKFSRLDQCCSIKLGRHLYTNPNKIKGIDDENHFLQKIDLTCSKDKTVYVGVWDDCDDQVFFTANTVKEIVNLCLKSFKEIYNVNEERALEYTYVEKYKQLMINKLSNVGNYYMDLHEHPLDDDLSAPSLYIRKMTVM